LRAFCLSALLVGHARVQPGLRHVPEFRRGDFQGGPEGYQQGGSGAGSAPAGFMTLGLALAFRYGKKARQGELLRK